MSAEFSSVQLHCTDRTQRVQLTYSSLQSLHTRLKMTNTTLQTHVCIFINVGHILVTVSIKAVRGDLFHAVYNRLRRVHLTGAFHNTMRHEVRDGNVRHAVRNVHRSFVGTFSHWSRLRDIRRVTAGLPGRHRAASTRTTDARSEESR